MNTKVEYSQYPTIITKFTIDLDKEHYIEFEPKSNVCVVDDVEVTEQFLNVKIHDKTILHDIETQVSLENLSDVIGVLQSIGRQIKEVKPDIKKCNDKIKR